jgi:hypothetical protein
MIYSFSGSESALLLRVLRVLPLLLGYPVVTAFIALNFTGSSTFTSRTGVKKEIYAYIPAMAWMFGISVAVTLGLYIWKVLEG